MIVVGVVFIMHPTPFHILACECYISKVKQKSLKTISLVPRPPQLSVLGTRLELYLLCHNNTFKSLYISDQKLYIVLNNYGGKSMKSFVENEASLLMPCMAMCMVNLN